MLQKKQAHWGGLLGLALALAVAGPSFAKKESKIKLGFENTGIDPDADGTLQFKLVDGDARLTLRLRHLEPSTDYRVLADEVEQTVFKTGAKGEAKLEFRAPEEDCSVALLFDPRTSEVVVDLGGSPVLRVDLLAAGSGRGRLKERTELDPGADVRGRAEARFQVRPNGRQDFRIKLKHVEGEQYELLTSDDPEVPGVERGIIATNAAGLGRIRFVLKQGNRPFKAKSVGNSRKSELDFDPLAHFVEIVRVGEAGQEDTLAFSGWMLSPLPASPACAGP